MAQNIFTNPSNAATYVWDQNHTDEEALNKTRTITRGAPTGQVGAVKQQGEEAAFTLKWTGQVSKRAQIAAMWVWYTLCQSQTIYLTDFDGNQYEGQITAFLPQRHRKLRATGRDPTVPYHYWTYTFEFEVYRIISGEMAGVPV